MDTIYAPASALGGAIAVIRISGRDALCAAGLFDKDIKKTPGKLRHVLVRAGGEIADDCMAVYFPAPGSYTGEDMIELHCHGGSQTVQLLLGLLAGCGFRFAEPGEYTRRAFENGKMDLSQAEAVMDVVTAEAAQSLRAAVRQLEGSVGRKLREAEDILLAALSGIDAALDYPDEAGEEAYAALPAQIAEAQRVLSRLIDEGRGGRVLRDGLHAAIVGRPNVGKSSLLNALLGRERAIVTNVPGTTRDVLDERTSLSGVPVRLIDTAGIREAGDEAERIGVTRARDAAQAADLVLLVLDGSMPLTGADAALLAETAARPRLLLRSKCDLPPAAWGFDGLTDGEAETLCISAQSGEGLERLKERIVALAAPGAASVDAITNERHIRALENALAALHAADPAAELDCVATDLRDALHHLGTITGRDVDAEVLDAIFARFCVGK